MLRAVALSLLVLFSIATLLPLAHSSAEGEGGRSSAASYRRKKRIRRHSRAWWRRYRAHLRRRRAAALLRAPEKAIAPENGRSEAATTISPSAFYSTGGTYNDPRGAFSLTMPIGWSTRPLAAGGELRFRVYAPDGRAVGQAALSVIPAAASGGGALSAKARARTLGGVSFADLNRTVIDKMIVANGWVINDMVREIGGRRVFIVLAQTAADGSAPQLAWTFYFTEMDGRIYNLAVNAPLEFSDRLAQESQQVMASFQMKPTSTLAGQTTNR
jgi:hypothetical protein